MNYLGDFAEDSTVRIPLTTNDASGAAVAPSSAFEAADFVIYKNGSATQKTSTNGITCTSPFDSVVGLHTLEIDTSNDTGDSGFWTTGADYWVVLAPDETVDSQTVVAVVAVFSIENRSKADVVKIAGSATAATNLKQSALALATGTVATDGSNTATTFKIDSTLGAKAANYFGNDDGGLVLAFVAGTANEWQSRRVVAFNATTDFITVEEPFNGTPTDADAFVLLGRITGLN